MSYFADCSSRITSVNETMKWFCRVYWTTQGWESGQENELKAVIIPAPCKLGSVLTTLK